MTMTIEITDSQTDLKIDHAKLRQIMKEALDDAGCAGSVSVALVTEEEMQRLNKTYTGREEPTDVLAFPMGNELLGDVAICPAKAVEQASARSCDPMDEILLYAVHGTLHLLGYDDGSDTAGEMYAKEDEILGRFGIGV